jgi:hypothetical protein
MSFAEYVEQTQVARTLGVTDQLNEVAPPN